MIIDLENKDYKTNFSEFDLIFIGAGTAGIVCAKEAFLNNPKLKIALLESGSLKRNKKIDQFDCDQSLDNKINFDKSINRFFGGKSNSWDGRIVDMDKSETDDWPISNQEFNYWKDKAYKLLGIDQNILKVEDQIKENLSNDFFKDLFEEDFNVSNAFFAKETKRFLIDTFNEFEPTHNISIFLHANVCELIKSKEDNKIEKVLVKSSLTQKKFYFKSHKFICSNGGIEVVRLLRSSNKYSKHGISNSSRLVGRNFSGHPRGIHGIIKLNKPIKLKSTILFGASRSIQNVRTEIGIKLASKILKEKNIQNSRICFEPIQFALHNKFFYKIKKIMSYQRDPLNEVGFLEKGYIEGFLLYCIYKFKKLLNLESETKFIFLRNYCASSLNPKSQIIIDSEKDNIGLFKAKVNWMINDSDKKSLIFFHENLANLLKEKKIGELKSNLSLGKEWKIWNGSSHFMSTTVMNKDPKLGVVDSDCRSHDNKNLFIIGPSVFPNPSYSNPMLAIVAISMRLGNFLAKL